MQSQSGKSTLISTEQNFEKLITSLPYLLVFHTNVGKLMVSGSYFWIGASLEKVMHVFQFFTPNFLSSAGRVLHHKTFQALNN